MRVSELIAILQTLDPSALVVVGTHEDRSDTHKVIELRRDDVRPRPMRLVPPRHSWFDPDHGAKLYEIHECGAVPGVEIS